MAEFTKLSEVQIVEAVSDTANVLIEENGKIKRVPKSEVGGNSKWDAVFTVDNVYNITADTVHLISGGFDSLKEKADKNDLPKVLVIASYEYGDVCISYSEPIHLQYNITLDAFTVYFRSNWEDSALFHFSLFSDDTITLDTWA